MENNELLQAVMGLIMYGGNAKSECMEAIQLAKDGDIVAANEKIEAANESLLQAHHSQTSLLTQEAGGENVEVSLMLIHAQDHLMNAITFRDLAKEIIVLHEKLKK